MTVYLLETKFQASDKIVAIQWLEKAAKRRGFLSAKEAIEKGYAFI